MLRAYILAGCAMGLLLVVGAGPVVAESGAATRGRLEARDARGAELGECPLQHTDVQVEIAGFIARVTVTQKFQNLFSERIEAVYVFPLSQDAAVDRMLMRIGDRTIKGAVLERNEALRTYQAARQSGKLASLLDQERPNIFTQSVANIRPGEQVEITLSYTETLDWREGVYHFDFPTVVGERYIPGTPSVGAPGTGVAPPTDRVPDAGRISPPVAPEGTRAGHDLSIRVEINAGLPIRAIDSPQFPIGVEYPEEDKSRAIVTVRPRRTLPNRDFVLTYQTASDQIADSLIAHTDERGNFFTLVLQPPARVAPEAVVPRELVFVIDKSGSMSGTPIETAKNTMRRCIAELQPADTFNLITFSGGVGSCFDGPVRNTKANRELALDYLDSLAGSGGTEMLPAIRACLGGRKDVERLRVVCFMTDGFVGNDLEIIDAVQEHAGVARVFAFGIGTSVNRYLLDGIARAGRGEVEYVLDDRQAAGAAERFAQRVRAPVLTDIELDWGDLDVERLYPRKLPDLFSNQPLVIKGRYTEAGEGRLTLRGKTGLGVFSREIKIKLPKREPKNDALAPLWARARVAELMNGDLTGIQQGNPDEETKKKIVSLGLRYNLVTQFTSFVAVEERKGRADEPPRKVNVPLEVPQGSFGQRAANDDQLTKDTHPIRGLNTLIVTAVAKSDGSLKQIAIGDVVVENLAELDRKLGSILTDQGGAFDQVILQVDSRLRADATQQMIEACMDHKLPGGKQSKLGLVELPVAPGSSPMFEAAGGAVAGGDSSFGGLGANIAVDSAAGFGKNMGTGGAGAGFGSRGSGMREAMLGTGGTKQSERAVAAALNWLARHQNADGCWNLDPSAKCKSEDCSCRIDQQSDAAATALALLPFLAAGQTQVSKGPYQRNIASGIDWLIKNQKNDGDLAAGRGELQMDAHALATIALCEAYGMTQESRLGYAAQAAIEWIEKAQNKQGGWDRKRGGEKSDPLLFGWQVMALKSGQMAGLDVKPECLERCKAYLVLGNAPGSSLTAATTAAGLLAAQHLGAKRSDPVLVDGTQFLLKHLPAAESRDALYWHFATQVMHQQLDANWDTWNRQTRRLLLETQAKTGCAAGSWDADPRTPGSDQRPGGRLVSTCLSVLTLEVYYRYLPLYQLEHSK